VTKADSDYFKFIINVVCLDEVGEGKRDFRRDVEYGKSAASEQNSIEARNLLNCRYLSFRYFKSMPLLVIV
jgi:hypothetical protein